MFEYCDGDVILNIKGGGVFLESSAKIVIVIISNYTP